MPLSPTDADDARRYTGYPVQSALIYLDVATVAYSAQLDATLAGLTDNQITILQNDFLIPLRILETAIPASGQNLDTDRAAVWYHNKQEVTDRLSLYMITRRNLCYFLGVPAGDGVVPLAPAVFTV